MIYQISSHFKKLSDTNTVYKEQYAYPSLYTQTTFHGLHTQSCSASANGIFSLWTQDKSQSPDLPV